MFMIHVITLRDSCCYALTAGGAGHNGLLDILGWKWSVAALRFTSGEGMGWTARCPGSDVGSR